MAENKALSGKTVLLTRENNESLSGVLSERGATALEIPLIKVEHSAREEDARDVMDEMGHYDWITFSSANGVKGFFREFFKRFDDIRCIGIARIACVGSATEAELKKYHLRADAVPDISTAEAMIEKMAEYETLENLKVLCVRGNLSSPDAIRALESKHNAITDSIEVYKTSPVDLKANPVPDIEKFRKGGADAVVFASPSAVESFLSNAQSLATRAEAKRPKIISIGPATSAALRKRDLQIAKESPSPYPEAVADSIVSALSE